jgi:type I restriction enzyme S subunit
VNTGATVGKTAIVEENEFTRKTTFQKSVAVVKVLKQHIVINYLNYFYINQTPKLLKKSGGSAINNLLLGDMKKILTPLPPLEEQKAIVKKVNSLMALCDSLEEHIEHSQTQIEQLMQSCLREVFEE